MAPPRDDCPRAERGQQRRATRALGGIGITLDDPHQDRGCHMVAALGRSKATRSTFSAAAGPALAMESAAASATPDPD
jgi:hypothetical protein